MCSPKPISGACCLPFLYDCGVLNLCPSTLKESISGWPHLGCKTKDEWKNLGESCSLLTYLSSFGV